jgi:hypothetical protein
MMLRPVDASRTECALACHLTGAFHKPVVRLLDEFDAVEARISSARDLSRRESPYSGARSRIARSVFAPCASGGGASPDSAIRRRCASSQWRPSKNRLGFRLGRFPI